VWLRDPAVACVPGRGTVGRLQLDRLTPQAFAKETALKFVLLTLAAIVSVTLGLLTVSPTHAAIHEIVAAYCSGGDVGVIGDDGFLEPPGITDPTAGNFAQPVLASGATTAPDAGGVIHISDKPNAKYPEGTEVVDLTPPPPTSLLNVSESDHPSAEHCPGASDLP